MLDHAKYEEYDFHLPSTPTPTPGSRLDLAFREELVAYSKNRIAESWGESVNGIDAETLARQIVGAQEWMWIARGFPVESADIQAESGSVTIERRPRIWSSSCAARPEAKCGACKRVRSSLRRRDESSEVMLCDACWYGDD